MKMFIINQNSPKNSQIIGKILTKCAKMTDEEYHQQFEQNSVKKSVNGVLAVTTNSTATISTISPGSTSSSSKANENGKHQSPNSNSSNSNGPSSSSSSGTPPGATVGPKSATNGKNGHENVHSGNNSSGGRLQFFKDGKFILELARAKEGEKTSWVSVPRKTFWPPTVSSTNVNFHKHESSTSLSLVSDDNSSIQSSPSFHRDQKVELRIFHTWKQASPRRNVSKEMVLHYHRPRPIKFQFSKESLKELRIKKRRPYDTTNVDLKLSYTVLENEKLPESGRNDEGTDNTDAIAKKRRRKKRPELASIVQKLTTKVTSNLLMSGGSVRNIFAATQHQHHVSPRKRILREFEKVSLEDTTTMKRSRPKLGAGSATATTTTASLASSNSNHNSSNCNNNNNNSSSSSSNSNNKLANGLTNEQSRTSTVASGAGPPTTPVSRPISSYSIKSLLEHNTSNDSNHHHHHSNSNVKKESTSHHYHHVDHLKTSGVTSPKSPSDHMGRYYGGKKRSPSYSNNNTASPSSSASDYTNYTMIRSPDLSPSPEHQQTGHSFQRYRQHPYNIPTSSPRYSPSPSTNDSTSPYSGKYRTNYLTGSPPSAANNNSPQHYSRQSPILSNYNHRKSPLNFNRALALNDSPTHHMSYSKNNNKESSPPMNEVSMSTAVTPTQTTTSSSIRTVPKKTAALRQQFGSPVSSPSSNDRDRNRSDYYRDRSNSNTSNASATTPVDHKPSRKDLDYSNGSGSVLSGIDVVDSMPSHLIRPSTMLPTTNIHHTATALQYMYPPQLAAAPSSQHIPPHLAAYYHQMYSQAIAASAYGRSQFWMHPSIYPSLHGPPVPLSSSSPASSSTSSGPPTGKLNLNGPSTIPWGLMPPHHLPMDEAVANSVKEEPSSDVPLNLSKH